MYVIVNCMNNNYVFRIFYCLVAVISSVHQNTKKLSFFVNRRILINFQVLSFIE